MPDLMPMTQASDAELATAVHENLFALFRAMVATLPESEIVEGEELCHHQAFPSNPMFKGVWRTRLAADDVDKGIERTIAWFKARNAPFAFWWTGLDSEPSGLTERLQAHGFAPNIIGDPGMAVDLHTLNEAIQTPDGFRIVQASDRQALEDWRDTFCASFEIPLWAGQAWADATARAGIANAPWRLYVGYLNDQPVATNILFKGAGVASVYGVGTRPEARGQGIGAAITLKPLLDARRQGYHFGVLFSTEMGQPVYRRLGFHMVNCRIGRYLWMNHG